MRSLGPPCGTVVKRPGSGHKATDHRSVLCPATGLRMLVYFSATVPSFVIKKKKGGRERGSKVKGREERKRTGKKLLITPKFIGNSRLSTTISELLLQGNLNTLPASLSPLLEVCFCTWVSPALLRGRVWEPASVVFRVGSKPD